MVTPEQRSKYWKKYYEEHRKELIQKVREQRNADRPKFRAQQRQYRANNREKFLKRERDYYKAHSKQILESKREAQRLRSRVKYWEHRDHERWLKEVAELDAYLRRRDLAKQMRAKAKKQFGDFSGLKRKEN